MQDRARGRSSDTRHKVSEEGTQARRRGGMGAHPATHTRSCLEPTSFRKPFHPRACWKKQMAKLIQNLTSQHICIYVYIELYRYIDLDIKREMCGRVLIWTPFFTSISRNKRGPKWPHEKRTLMGFKHASAKRSGPFVLFLLFSPGPPPF